MAGKGSAGYERVRADSLLDSEEAEADAAAATQQHNDSSGDARAAGCLEILECLCARLSGAGRPRRPHVTTSSQKLSPRIVADRPGTVSAAAALTVTLQRSEASGYGMVISKEGIVSSIDLEGPAGAAQVPANSLITHIDGSPVCGREHIMDALQARRDSGSSGAVSFTFAPQSVQRFEGVEPNSASSQSPTAQRSPQLGSRASGLPAHAQRGADAADSDDNDATLLSPQRSAEDTAAAVEATADPEANEQTLSSFTGKEAHELVERIRATPGGAALRLSGELQKLGDVRLQPRHFFLFDGGWMIFAKASKKPRGTYEVRRVVAPQELATATVETFARTPLAEVRTRVLAKTSEGWGWEGVGV